MLSSPGWFCVVAAIASLTIHHTTMASTYHISPQGNDQADGSATHPFATIQRGLNEAKPGDTVRVARGRYHERLSFPRSGEKNSPITLEGEPGALIDGGERHGKGWQPAPEVGAGVFKKLDIPFPARVVTWGDKFIVTLNTASPFWQKRETIEDALAMPVENNGGFVPSKGDEKWATPNWWDGVEAVYAFYKDAHYIRFRHGGDPNGQDLSFAPEHSEVISIQQDFITVRGMTVRTGHWGIAVKSNDCIIEDNFVSCTGKSNILVAGHRNHIRNNELTQGYIYADYGHPWRDPLHRRMWTVNKGYMWPDTMAIRMEDHGDDTHIYGNHVFRHFDGIVEKEGGGKHTRVYNNIVQNILDDPMAPEGAMVDSQWFDNVLIEGGSSGQITLSPGKHFVGPAYIYRNRIYFTQLTNYGAGFHFKNAFEATSPLYIYHNSVCGNGASASVNQGWAQVPPSKNILFVNNILSSTDFYADSWQPKAQGGVGVFDYNWCGGDEAGRLQGRPNFGPHNIVANGKFLWLDRTNPDFQLPADSPACGKGIDLSSAFTILGEEYPPLPGMAGTYREGHVDLGAVQHGDKPAIPAAPSDLAISAAGDEVALRWKDNADNETHYLVDRSEDGQVFTTIARLPANSTTFIDRGVNQTRHYRVWAIQVQKGAWFSLYSNVVTSAK